MSFQQWRRQGVDEVAQETGSAPSTILQAALVNLLNPNPYLGWSLVLGPAVVAAWRVRPAEGVAVVVAFYAIMVAALAGTIVLFGTTRGLGPRGRRRLVLLSAMVLAALGVHNLGSSLR